MALTEPHVDIAWIDDESNLSHHEIIDWFFRFGFFFVRT